MGEKFDALEKVLTERWANGPTDRLRRYVVDAVTEIEGPRRDMRQEQQREAARPETVRGLPDESTAPINLKPDYAPRNDARVRLYRAMGATSEPTLLEQDSVPNRANYEAVLDQLLVNIPALVNLQAALT
jgi:hypothetical protein